MNTYTATVFADSGLWVIEIPELDAVSQTRTLAAAETEARHLAAVWLDIPADQVEVTVDYSRVDPQAWQWLREARDTQAEADAKSHGAAATRRRAARRLVRDRGLSVRDAAAVLGISFSRVQQLTKD
jgi:predicted RNase H-like HicB family nuclease